MINIVALTYLNIEYDTGELTIIFEYYSTQWSAYSNTAVLELVNTWVLLIVFINTVALHTGTQWSTSNTIQ